MQQQNNGKRRRHFTQRFVTTKSDIWTDWKRKWCKPLPPEERIRMLDYGFRVGHNRGDEEERVCFYLMLADRYDDRLAFGEEKTGEHVSTIRGYPSSGPELNRMIASKAFAVLCESVFKWGIEDEQKQSIPYYLPFNVRVCRRLLWFFRRREPGCSSSNMRPVTTDLFRDGGKHYLETAREFAARWSVAVWSFESFAQYQDIMPAERRKIHQSLRPFWREALDLMDRCDRLGTITQEERYPDEPQLRQLEKEVMAEELFFLKEGGDEGEREKRRPVSLLEASLHSRLARVLLSIRLQQNPKAAQMRLPHELAAA